jgi:flavin-dependent thymidylate synthase
MNNSNSVELLGWYGGDEAIACSAWTSTSRDLTPEKKERIGSLIEKLWKADPVPHGSPFEKGIVHFLVNSDIASHIHLLKHRMANINAESARYKELKEDKMYLPEDWKEIKASSEASSVLEDYWGEFDGKDWYEILEAYTKKGNELYHLCLSELTPVLGRKRAKESARYFKTYNSQIQCDVMFNMRSFHNFLNQRMDSHAQKEIQEIAKEMLNLVKNIEGSPFEYTLKAWGY